MWVNLKTFDQLDMIKVFYVIIPKKILQWFPLTYRHKAGKGVAILNCKLSTWKNVHLIMFKRARVTQAQRVARIVTFADAANRHDNSNNNNSNNTNSNFLFLKFTVLYIIFQFVSNNLLFPPDPFPVPICSLRSSLISVHGRIDVDHKMAIEKMHIAIQTSGESLNSPRKDWLQISCSTKPSSGSEYKEDEAAQRLLWWGF